MNTKRLYREREGEDSQRWRILRWLPNKSNTTFNPPELLLTPSRGKNVQIYQKQPRALEITHNSINLWESNFAVNICLCNFTPGQKEKCWYELSLSHTWQQPTWIVNHIQLAFIPAAGDSSESLELVPTESVQPLVPGGVLDEPGLVAEPVVAVLPHAVEVGLVLSVVAVWELAIFIESENILSLLPSPV